MIRIAALALTLAMGAACGDYSQQGPNFNRGDDTGSSGGTSAVVELIDGHFSGTIVGEDLARVPFDEFIYASDDSVTLTGMKIELDVVVSTLQGDYDIIAGDEFVVCQAPDCGSREIEKSISVWGQ